MFRLFGTVGPSFRTESFHCGPCCSHPYSASTRSISTLSCIERQSISRGVICKLVLLRLVARTIRVFNQIDKGKSMQKRKKAPTLRSVADHVGLSTGTVSLVLNDSPQAKSIPQHTKDRVLEAARVLNYRPNPFARALRSSPMATSWEHARSMQSGTGALVFVTAQHVQRAMEAIRQAGLRMPDDVSMIGVEGFPQGAANRTGFDA